MEHASELGHHALERMTEMMERHLLIRDVHGIGLFMGRELVKNRSTRERATDEAEAVMYNVLPKGLSFKLTMGNIITLTQALIITKDEMDKALDIIEEYIFLNHRFQGDQFQLIGCIFCPVRDLRYGVQALFQMDFVAEIQ